MIDPDITSWFTHSFVSSSRLNIESELVYSYNELVREIEISYVYSYMYVEKCMMSCGIKMHVVT